MFSSAVQMEFVSHGSCEGLLVPSLSTLKVGGSLQGGTQCKVLSSLW